MPVMRWGVSAKDVDDFDRESQFKPYAGPTPPNTVYAWRIKVMSTAPATRTKNASWRVGLELVPREGFNEDKYAGFFVMDYLPIADNTAFRYVPLLDALGVSGREFETRTKTNPEGKVISIGKWRNDGETIVTAMLQDGEDDKGNSRKEIKAGTYGELPDHIELSDGSETDDDELPDEDDFSEDVIDEDFEEEEAPRRKPSGGKMHGRTSTSGSRRRSNAVQRKRRARRASRVSGAMDYEEEDGF